jgi:hypothetical protein
MEQLQKPLVRLPSVRWFAPMFLIYGAVAVASGAIGFAVAFVSKNPDPRTMIAGALVGAFVVGFLLAALFNPSALHTLLEKAVSVFLRREVLVEAHTSAPTQPDAAHESLQPFDLNEILQNAQGGHAISNLAQQFGISQEQAQAATRVLVDAVAAGLAKCATEPNALGPIISAIADGDHTASFSNPPSPQAVQKGSDALTQIFGSNHIVQQIAQQASRFAGLRPDLLVQMLPVIVSILFGGLATSLRNQGLGTVLDHLLEIVKQVRSPLGTPYDSAVLSTSLDTLTRMLQPGALRPSATQSGQQDEIAKILSGRLSSRV